MGDQIIEQLVAEAKVVALCNGNPVAVHVITLAEVLVPRIRHRLPAFGHDVFAFLCSPQTTETLQCDKYQYRMIGKVLARYRKKANLTQEKLSSLAKVDRAYISNLERDRKKFVSLDIFIRLCEAMNVKASTVLSSFEKSRSQSHQVRESK